MKVAHKITLILVLGIFTGFSSYGQKFSFRHHIAAENEDTIRGVVLPEFTIKIPSKSYRAKYEKTRSYVVRCIALANFIRDFTSEMDETVASMNKNKARKKYLKAEKEKLFNSFSDICKDMSKNEGYYFNKLVYRQTGITTYEAIKKYQGSVKAMLWQSVARLGGAGLKLTYDPYYSDKVIEDVMQQIEAGKIKIPRLPRTVAEFNNPVYD